MTYYDGSDGKGEWWDAQPMDRKLYDSLELERLKRNSLITHREYMERNQRCSTHTVV
jgi:hypothetical protein